MKSSKNAVKNIEGLVECLPENYGETDRELVLRAYRIAVEAHRLQKRNCGEPYITHCLAVAQILAELKMSPDVIAAGLLHDTVEDTSITLDFLRREFGETIASLVNGVTKLTDLPRVSRGDQHADEKNGKTEEQPSAASLGRKEDIVSETLRKTFIAMGKDMRVMFIKLADRLHNMRTLEHMPDHKRKRIAKETLEIFAPVASRLGIWQIKWELEDLAFFNLNPEKYAEIAGQLRGKRQEREEQIESIKETVARLLLKKNIQGEVSGRPKHIYSIYRKMQRKGKTFSELQDIRAVRIIVDSEDTCYHALGVIHSAWRPIPGEFDDYIAAPKNNLYKSLHTAVIYRDGHPLEIQIRTQEMHLEAEYGLAAHWQYKEDGKNKDESFKAFLASLRSVMESESQEARSAAEFVETMRSDVFQDRVYVFTPNGDIIDLPAGATSIDFAYHVHTDIGHRCRGARINGKLSPLSQELQTGDRVEILTAKPGAGPSRDWLNTSMGSVHTSRALSKIRTWFRKQEDSVNLQQGRAALEAELRRLGLKVNFENLARSLNFKTPEEFFLSLGRGDLSIHKALREIGQEEEERLDVLKPNAPATQPSSALEVIGMKDMLYSMAKCCHPMPGEAIIGYVTRGRGATIHRRDCPNIIRSKDYERLLKVHWGKSERTYPAPIVIKAYDRPGLVSDVSKLLSDENINITDVGVTVIQGVADLRLVIEIQNISQLSRILNMIGNIQNIIKVYRASPG